MTEFPRITRNPKVMGGKPCIRGMRVTVGMIAGQIGAVRRLRKCLSIFRIWNGRTSWKPSAMRGLSLQVPSMI